MSNDMTEINSSVKQLKDMLNKHINKSNLMPKTIVPTIVYINNEYKFRNTKDLFEGKTILLGFPSAFSPLCENQQIIQYLEEDNFNKFKLNGYKLVFISANNIWVSKAFAKHMDYK